MKKKYLCSSGSWIRQNQWDMGSEQDLTSGNRLFLQNHKAEAVLRANQPTRPCLEKDRGRAQQGQDMPARHRGDALRRFQQIGA